MQSFPTTSDYEHELSGLSDVERLNQRRRLQGACEECRRKKIKCDRSIAENKECSNCVKSRSRCQPVSQTRQAKEGQKEYIQKLEERLHMAEEKLQMKQLGLQASTVPSNREVRPTTNSRPASAQEIALGSRFSSYAKANDDVEDSSHIILAERLESLSIEHNKNRFFGPSSAMSFFEQAVTTRQEHGDFPTPDGHAHRREYFWCIPERVYRFVHSSGPLGYVFPEPDLLDALVSIFFERIHIVLPAIHRPSFERNVRNREHLSNPWFGMVVLAVCALAARHSDDPRVFLEEGDGSGFKGSSAGWKYMAQVPLWRNTVCNRPTAYDMQFYALATFYFMGTSMSQVCWSLAGLGLRLAVEKGLHRSKGSNYKPNVEDETEKRAFWCLVASDRVHSAFLGRPSALQDEDIDCEHPIACDDEFWEAEDPSDAFKQPSGRPCYTAAFIYQLKLCEILGFMSRTLFSIKKSKIMTGLIGENWEARIVAELDSSLNKWKDSLPQNLAWDPSNQDSKLFNQSLFLHSTFYFIQIQVHGTSLGRSSMLSSPSVAICTNAARACSRFAEDSVKRQKYTYPNVMMATFLAAMVLTVHFWSSRPSKTLSLDPEREMVDIDRCRAFMLQAEKRWYLAGRLRDMISEFNYVRGPTFLEVPGGKTLSEAEKRNQRSGTIDLSSIPRRKVVTDPVTPSAITASSMATTGAFRQYEPKESIPVMPELAMASSHLNPISDTMQPSSGQVGAQYQHLSSHNEPMKLQWDLSSLLFANMGYEQPLGNSFPVPVTDSALNTGRTYSNYNDGIGTPQNPSNAVPAMGQEAHSAGYHYADPHTDMSMWMSGASSSLERWDEFIATTTEAPAQ